MCSDGMSLNQVSDPVEDYCCLFWSESKLKFREDALQWDSDVDSLTGLGCVCGLDVCTGEGECRCVRQRFGARWAELTCAVESWTLHHPGLRGCCTDLRDDKRKAWHLTVESILALTDSVGSGVGQSGLVGFLYNMTSSPGFSVDWCQNGAGDVWGPSVLPR